ncbi:lycopene cyclase family protein [Rhodococcus chondri]|uniref:Lycopene cyclase family protein n=1 Tax=Rhodococcus chondri TaxID=3065941 RepID=A0ABU7JSC2_9NOCA|nr:lycopene cyclase family protein [Rhodococcus sp. CC-R104]MEE2032926.1 lycopene cyclase family protein [Rhodococcus sp. CC-R104]
MTTSRIADVLVAGLGPAGRTLASRAHAAGLEVVAVDPHPDREWTATYGAWADELPSWLPAGAVASRVDEPAVWAGRPHVLNRAYCIFDTAALRAALPLDPVTVTAGRVRSLDPGGAVLDDGRRLRARYVVDARGVPVTAQYAQQSAFGVVVDEPAAAPALESRSAWFMDWRTDNGTVSGDTPSFLYAMPVGAGRVLLEETCLVGRPPVPLQELRRRLDARLTARGVPVDGSERIERVRFAVEAPPRRRDGVLGFGARGGLMHPATGYAVGTALATADAVVTAMRNNADPDEVLWTRAARAVAALRSVGLRALLRLDATSTAEFFSEFFELPPAHQRAYLSRRDDLAGTAAAMWKLFGAVPPRMRGALVRAMW